MVSRNQKGQRLTNNRLPNTVSLIQEGQYVLYSTCASNTVPIARERTYLKPEGHSIPDASCCDWHLHEGVRLPLQSRSGWLVPGSSGSNSIHSLL